MAALPLETWTQIVSQLPYEALLACCKVSKTFLSMAQPLLMRHLKYGGRNANIRKMGILLQSLCNRTWLADTIYSLRIQSVYICPARDFLYTLQRCRRTSRLAHLAISVEEDIESHYTTHIACPLLVLEFPFLRTLSYTGPSIHQNIISQIIRSANRLQDLRLIATSSVLVPLHIERDALANLHELERLEVQNVTSETVSTVIESCRSTLGSLNIQECGLDSYTIPSHLPRLREVHVERNCEDIIAATPIIYSLSVFEDHFPLTYLHNYPSACKQITYLRIVDNPYQEHFDVIRQQLTVAFRNSLLPNLQYIEVGCWSTLKLFLPYLPATLRQIDLYELEFAACSENIQETAKALSAPPAGYIKLVIHVEDDRSQYSAVEGRLNSNEIPIWLLCELRLMHTILWASGRDQKTVSRKETAPAGVDG